jgi:molybdate transport system substrate-binding protein
VVSAGDAVRGVAVPAAQNTTLDYPLLWLNRREHTVGFALLVDSGEGVAALTAAGFLAP